MRVLASGKNVRLSCQMEKGYRMQRYPKMKNNWLKPFHDQPQKLGELFDVCSNRSRGNTESHSAFQAVRDRLNESQERIYRCVKDSGEHGRTNDEICIVLGLTPNQVSPRITELHIAHRIAKIGTRPTRSKSPAGVWRAL